MKRILFLLTGLLFMLSGCSDGGSESPENPNPTPTPTPEETASITIDSSIVTNGVAFDAKGGEKSVSFSSNKDWTLSIATPVNGTAWCTVSETSGAKGDATVKFTVKENAEYDDRSVSVTIKAGTASKTFTIAQKCAEALLVTSAKFEVPQEGGVIEVEVKANVNYELQIAENAKSWISETKSRALTTKKHSFTIVASEEYEKREGEIHIKSGDKLEIVKVYQAGGAILMLSKNDCSVSSEGETISIDIKSNIEYGVQMPNVDWITDVSASRAASSHTLKYVVLPNETPDARSAEIIFYDKNSSLKDTLKVVQAQKDAIIISKKEYEVKAEGETIAVKLSTNVDFEVVMPEVDWVSQVTARALTEYTLYFKVAENKNYDDRSAEIVITNNASQLSEKIIVSQQKATLLQLTKDEYNVSDSGETISVELKSNIEYGVQIPEVDWITASPSARSVSADTLKFVVSPNETYNARSAEIIFYDKNGSLKDTLKVTQMQKNAIIISQKEYEVKAEGESIEVKLSANVDFEVIMPEVDWVSQVQSRALTDHVLYFKIAENTKEDSRSAEITFVNQNTRISEVLSLSQAGLVKVGYDTETNTVTLAKAGTLKDYLSNYEIQSLTVIGPLDKEDFQFIREQLLNLELLDISQSAITSLPSSAFENMRNLKKVNLPSYINEISAYAFKGCANLETIIIPKNIEVIQYGAFSNCISLKEVVFEKGAKLKKLAGYLMYNSNGVFYRCNSLTTISLPETLEEIGDACFHSCTSLIEISIPNNVKLVGYAVFTDCSSLSNVTISNQLTSLGYYMFSGCKLLSSIEIPTSVTRINKCCFENCGLKDVTLSDSIKVINEFAFAGCSSLISINIPKDIKHLSWYCFSGCTSLTEIIIPSKVENIHRSFSGCVNLKKIISYPLIPPVIDEYSFPKNDYKRCLYVPQESLDKYKNDVNWTDAFGDNILSIEKE